MVLHCSGILSSGTSDPDRRDRLWTPGGSGSATYDPWEEPAVCVDLDSPYIQTLQKLLQVPALLKRVTVHVPVNTQALC